MKSTLSELWYGNIQPLETDIFHTPEYREALSALSAHYSKFESTLSPEQKQLFNVTYNCRSQLGALAEEIAFSYGFKLGAKIIIETLFSATPTDV